VKYGKQAVKLEGAGEVWVLPSTSMQADSYWDERHWQELATEVKRLRKLG
jgi:G:T/U-mismatch repair DNA glycosylase